MDIDYKELIDFSGLKDLIKAKRTTVSYVAQDAGISVQRVSRLITGWDIPKTDALAKIAFALRCPVSEVVKFKNIVPSAQQKKWFEEHELPYQPPADAKGEVTYEPLRALLEIYLIYLEEQTGKEKNANDLLDLIEPYRRRNNIKSGVNAEVAKAGVEAKYGKGYEAENKRKYVPKGIIPEIRTKLKNDRPVNIRTIYDICNFFGCSIDWVMSYK